MRILGMDISKYEQRFDAGVAWRAGIRFVIVRAGYGLVADQRFEQHQKELEAVPGMVRGAYHYLSSAVDGVEQAKFLFGRANGWADFLAIDFEEAYNAMTPRFARSCLSAIEWLRANARVPVLLYTNPSIYSSVLLPVSQEFARVPLWIAHYPYRLWALAKSVPSSGREPRLPAGRKDWVIWQFTSNAPALEYGVQGKMVVDLDLWNWDAGDTEAWLSQFSRFSSLPGRAREQTAAAKIARRFYEVWNERANEYSPYASFLGDFREDSTLGRLLVAVFDAMLSEGTIKAQ